MSGFLNDGLNRAEFSGGSNSSGNGAANVSNTFSAEVRKRAVRMG